MKIILPQWSFNASSEVKYKDMEQGASIIPSGELFSSTVSGDGHRTTGTQIRSTKRWLSFASNFRCEVDPAIYFRIDEGASSSKTVELIQSKYWEKAIERFAEFLPEMRYAMSILSGLFKCQRPQHPRGLCGLIPNSTFAPVTLKDFEICLY